MFLIELHRPGQRRATVIETARSEDGAKRMARTLAKLRFGSPLFVANKEETAGGHWREQSTDGETTGETIHVTGG